MKTITISGIIGWDELATAEHLRAELAKAGGEEVEIVISSPGGLVSAGLEMFNLIRNYKGRTVARLSGWAMSMASYIPLAAQRIVAEDNAIYMIHNVRGGVWGDHNDILLYGETTKSMSAMLAKAYSRRTGKSLKEIAALMDRESYFFGDDMLEHGFVDEILAADADADKETSTAMARVAWEECRNTMSKDVTAQRQDLSRAAVFLGCLPDKPQSQSTKEKSMDIATLKAEHPDLVAQIVAEATAGMVLATELEGARTAGAEGERNRIKEVRAQVIPGHEALIEQLAMDGATTGPEAAAKVLAAEKELRGQKLADIEGSGSPVVPAVAAPVVDGSAAGGTIEEQAKAEWDKDADLRAEFGGKFESYLAYRNKAASGRARVFGKK